MKARVPLTTLLLIVGNACLLTAFGWQLWQGSERDHLLKVANGADEATFGAMDAPVVANIDAIQARAIFHKSRSFYVPPPPEVTQQPPPEYRLAGSMSVGGKQTAVLISSRTGARTRVSAGDQLEGWTVASIEPRKVTLQLGDRAAEITPTSGAQGGGVTVVGMQTAGAPVPVANGVRMIGNAPAGSPRPQASANDPLTHAPRLYRPPQQ